MNVLPLCQNSVHFTRETYQLQPGMDNSMKQAHESVVDTHTDDHKLCIIVFIKTHRCVLFSVNTLHLAVAYFSKIHFAYMSAELRHIKIN